MYVNREQLAQALKTWGTTAQKNGWGRDYKTADLTVWVDGDGNVTDSVATRTGGGLIRVVEDSERT